MTLESEGLEQAYVRFDVIAQSVVQVCNARPPHVDQSLPRSDRLIGLAWDY